MFELRLMASNGYPPALVLHREPAMSGLIKEYQPLLPSSGPKPELIRPGRPLNLQTNQTDIKLWKPIFAFSESYSSLNDLATITLPVIVDQQDDQTLSSVKFSSKIDEQCKRHEKNLQALISGPNEQDINGFDISLLSDLIGLHPLKTDPCQKDRFDNTLIFFDSESYHAPKPLIDFMGDLARNEKITVHPDGEVVFTGDGTDMKDLLSIVAEFYLSKNSLKWRNQSMLVPHFDRLGIGEVGGKVSESFVKSHATVLAPVKCPDKIKVKPSPKKKTSKKPGRDQRDLYKKNYFHACETLLSLMMDKKRHGKTSILSLKRCGPELPVLLTQFSAGIAGTGIAVLFSVVYKLACGRVPLCGSKLLSTGFGFGLVWLSSAVNSLRMTIMFINKNPSKSGLKDEETMKRVDKSMNEIYFRVVALIAVAALRIA